VCVLCVRMYTYFVVTVVLMWCVCECVYVYRCVCPCVCCWCVSSTSLCAWVAETTRDPPAEDDISGEVYEMVCVCALIWMMWYV